MRLAVVLSLALLLEACDGGSSAVPTSPTQAQLPEATFTVSGVVFGEGDTRLAGARVGIANRQGTTDGSGAFHLEGVRESYGGAFAAKEGYAAAREVLAVVRDMQLDFHLGPRVAVYTLSGVVTEATPTGPVPIPGVLVTSYSCEDTPAIPSFFPTGGCLVSVSQDATTDKSGFYRISGLYTGNRNSIGLSKDGFDDPRRDPNAQEGSGHDGKGQEIVLSGDTRIDLQLVRR